MEAISARLYSPDQTPREDPLGPPAGEAGDPALRELIMADIDETTSALPASQAELPTSEDTAPCTTSCAPLLPSRTQQGGSQVLTRQRTTPHGSREEQTPANEGLPASLPLSAPPGRRAGGPEPDSPMTGENYALSAQSMSRRCMQGLTNTSKHMQHRPVQVGPIGC